MFPHRSSTQVGQISRLLLLHHPLFIQITLLSLSQSLLSPALPSHLESCSQDSPLCMLNTGEPPITMVGHLATYFFHRLLYPTLVDSSFDQCFGHYSMAMSKFLSSIPLLASCPPSLPRPYHFYFYLQTPLQSI